jgi:7-carboxy-7-deazaguanine synthase
MHITEIFNSIQGEGTRAGLPCIFVRLTGCNLRCTWCDTAYAFQNGKKMSVEEVIGRVDQLSGRSNGTAANVKLVELTGGEPLLQEEIYPLADQLLAAGYTVLIETSGERFIGRLPKEVIKIVDVKCPDSGEPDTFDPRNLDELGAKDEIKFVLSSRKDYEFARQFTEGHRDAVLRSMVFQQMSGQPGKTRDRSRDRIWENRLPTGRHHEPVFQWQHSRAASPDHRRMLARSAGSNRSRHRNVCRSRRCRTVFVRDLQTRPPSDAL